MEISEYSRNGVPLLKVRGEVDHSNSMVFRQAVEKALQNEERALILDFEEVPHLDSGGIAVLLALLRRMRRNRGWLGVFKPSEGVVRLLDMVGFTLDQNFFLFRTEEELREALAR